MPQLTYANVMSTLAVFFALSGSAYAAVTITGRDIVDESITGRDVEAGSLQSSDIKDGSLREQDFLPGTLAAGAEGQRGPAGPAGPAGLSGERGAQGERGPAGADGKDGARGPAGADGEDGDDGAGGAPGAPGTPGAPGAPGDDGTAVAYGTLNGASVFDAKGLTNANVTYPAAGVYCLKGLGFSFKSVMTTVVSPDPAHPEPRNFDQFAQVYSDPAGFTNAVCGANTQVMVTVYDVGAGISAGGMPAGFAAASVNVWFED